MTTVSSGTSSSGNKRHNTIAVASGKGGVGKTWLSITLAHAIAAQNYRTLLFDGDLGLANVDIQLGLMPKHDLGGVISGRLSLNQAILSYEEGGFDIIIGRSGSGSLANIPASRLQMLTSNLALLSAAYSQVVIDLSTGIERVARQIAQMADICLVITTDEPTALTDAYAFIKIIHMEKSTRDMHDIRIVVNMAASRKEGERTYNTLLKACEGFLKISPPLAGIIRNDTSVRDAVRAQTPLLISFPTSEAGEDVQNIARRLIKGQE